MSSKRKNNSIADQINSILKPKELVEEQDENEARVEQFDEKIEVNNQLSAIRKQTAKHLGEIDSKYKGKVVSRKELGLEADSSESSENGDHLLSESDDDENEEEQANESEESDEDEEESEENDDSNEESDAEEDDDYGDFDISQFSSQKDPVSQNERYEEKDNAVLLKKSSTNEEVKKGICVQNQLNIWEKMLEMRIKVQKMLITANSFPDFDSFIELSEIQDSPFVEKIEDACDGLYNVLDNLLELQSSLVQGYISKITINNLMSN